MAERRPSGLELGLYALCWAGPLAIGAVHPTTQVVLGAAALGLMLAAGLGPLRERGLRLPPLAWVMAAALGWTMLQLVPLPIFLLRWLSPQAAALRSEVGARWAPITLDAAATWIELSKQIGYASIFLVASEVLRTRDATRRAATAISLFGLTMVVLVVVHRVFGIERIYGVYQLRTHPGSPFFGPFVNVNHAASALVLCTLVSFGLAAGRQGYVRAAFIFVGAACGVATLETSSRGGALALCLGAFVLITLLASAHYGRLRGVLLAAAVTLVVGASAFTLTNDLRGRFLLHQAGNSLTENQKTRGWLVATRLAQQFPLVGVGRGVFEYPAAAFRVEEEGVRQVYAEDVVLQIVTEWGVPIAMALLVMAVWLLGVALLQLPIEPELAGLCAALIAVAAHGLVDCGFEFPGVLFPWAMVLGALVARAEAEKRSRRRARPRVRGMKLAAMGVAAAGILGFAARALPLQWETESENLRAEINAHRLPSEEQLAAILARHPANAEAEILAGQVSLRRPDAHALHHLGRAMRLQPSSNLPHHLAAVDFVRLHRMKQAALEYRLAIERGAAVQDPELVSILGSAAIDAVPRTADAYTQLGVVFAGGHRWQDAERSFMRAIEAGGGKKAQLARMNAFQSAPADEQLAAAQAVANESHDPEELALVVRTYAALSHFDRADEVFRQSIALFPNSAQLVIEGARARAARGDVDGARRLLGKTNGFDGRGRLQLAELAVELADRAGDVDGASAARARLRLLRARSDNMEGR